MHLNSVNYVFIQTITTRKREIGKQYTVPDYQNRAPYPIAKRKAKVAHINIDIAGPLALVI